MVRRRKQWVWIPSKPDKPPVPAALKAEVEAKAGALIEEVLRPRHVKPPPDDERFNYVVDLGARWYRNYFYLFATYRCPGPNALAPYFEAKFARLQFIGANRFHLAWMRHTGQWFERDTDLTLDECLETIRDDPFFFP